MTTKITKEFIDILKKSNDINQSLMIVEGRKEIRTKSENKTTFMVTPTDAEFSRDLNIYDVREFVSALNLINEPVVDLSKDNIIKIQSSDGKQSIRYIECDPNMISSYAETDPNLQRIEFTIDVDQDLFSSVVNAARVMGLNYIGFFGDGEAIRLSAFGMNDGDGRETNNFTVDIGESPVDVNFDMFFDLEKSRPSVLLNEGSLTISVSSSPKAIKVEAESGKVFYLAFDNRSTYGVDHENV